MSRDRLSRATRYWGTAFNASRVDEAIYRFAAGSALTDEDRGRFGLVGAFLKSALGGYQWTRAMIEDHAPPEVRDLNQALDDLRFMIRVLDKDVKDPETEIQTLLDLTMAFAQGRADQTMITRMRWLAQRLQSLASNVAAELNRGCF